MSSFKVKEKSGNMTSSFSKKEKAKQKVVNRKEIYSHSSKYSRTIVNGEIQNRQKDFLQENKKNLKNFFADRLPPPDISIYQQKSDISPTKIRKYRMEQLENRQKTQISLNNSFELLKIESKPEISKINETFYINDKNRDLRMKYTQKNKKQFPFFHESYKNGTESSINKKSRILKQEAYETVFGMSKASFSLNAKKKTQIFKINGKKTSRSFQKRKSQISEDDRDKFNILLKKISSYAVQYKPSNNIIQDAHKEIHGAKVIGKQEIQKEEKHEKNIINWAKSFSNSLKINIVGKKRAERIEDLSKTDSKFFQEMKRHKMKRLKARQQGMAGTFQDENQPIQNTPLQSLNVNFEDDSVLITASERIQDSSWQKQKPDKNQNTIKERFKNFSKNLIEALQKVPLYGIQKEDIFDALWFKRSPFQMEGSYVFFKAIKKGDLNIIKDFVSRDKKYLYQIDQKKRSTLIYATLNQKAEIVKFFISKGVNIEHKCSHEKNALFYALSLGNFQIVKTLLKAGSSPWSTDYCEYKLEHVSKQNYILMRNARKISIAFKLQQSLREKWEFWQRYKEKIQEHKLIQFK